MQLLQTITAAIGKVWARGCLGKGIVIFGVLIVLGMCGSIFGSNRTTPAVAPAPIPTDAPAPTEMSATAAPEPTEVPDATNTPSPTLAPLPTLAGVRPTGSDCPADHPVKGNIRDREPDKGAKIYHLPGSSSYDATKPERCFVDAAEAEQAGYRAPK